MDLNASIKAMLGTVSEVPAPNVGPQSGPSARGSVAPSVSAIATNGKISLQVLSKLAETLQSVRDDLST